MSQGRAEQHQPNLNQGSPGHRGSPAPLELWHLMAAAAGDRRAVEGLGGAKLFPITVVRKKPSLLQAIPSLKGAVFFKSDILILKTFLIVGHREHTLVTASFQRSPPSPRATAALSLGLLGDEHHQ